MAKTQHVHKFKRHTYKTGNVVYFCTLPDCSVKVNPSLALGKRSICWRCGNAFEMNEYSIRLAKPHCQDCHKPKLQKLEGGEEYFTDGVITSQSKIIEYDSLTKSIGVDTLSDLRSRLSGMQAKPDDEGDI